MNEKGFTTIELIIAAAIFSFMVSGLTIALMQQQRQYNLTRELADMDQTARASLDFIVTEIRNSVSRQGKTFSLSFVNGGSDPGNQCAANTDSPGSEDSPPDCLTLYTWDITKGQDGNNFPSTASSIEVVSAGPPLVIQLPKEWFEEEDGTLLPAPLAQAGDYLGFRSRINLCSLDDIVNCGANPDHCTECAAILQISSIDTSTKRATINDDTSLIKEHNFPTSNFTDMAGFINGVSVNDVDYGFVPSISSLPSEMTIVQTKTFRINRADRTLEVSQNGGVFQPIAGGEDAPGIVDLQFVFNLQDSDGGTTKVGLPLTDDDRLYPDFQSNSTFFGSSIAGREKDIRTVEIYLMVRSRLKAHQIGGETVPVRTIPGVGDVLERETSHTSLGKGYLYRILSTTIYIRNMSREEFG